MKRNQIKLFFSSNLKTLLMFIGFNPHGLSYCRNTKQRQLICTNRFQTAILKEAPLTWGENILTYYSCHNHLHSKPNICAKFEWDRKGYGSQTTNKRAAVLIFHLSILILYSTFSIPLRPIPHFISSFMYSQQLSNLHYSSG